MWLAHWLRPGLQQLSSTRLIKQLRLSLSFLYTSICFEYTNEHCSPKQKAGETKIKEENTESELDEKNMLSIRNVEQAPFDGVHVIQLNKTWP